MPVGKSGKYYMNPHEMRRKEGSSADAKGGDKMGDKMPAKDEGHESGAGDGNHHHEIHMHEDGTAHSLHTHPDGREEPMEHGSYDEAKGHMDQMMGQGEEPDGDEAGDNMDSGDGDDMAGMYAEGCE
jgi:hypothetical protein